MLRFFEKEVAVDFTQKLMNRSKTFSRNQFGVDADQLIENRVNPTNKFTLKQRKPDLGANF